MRVFVLSTQSKNDRRDPPASDDRQYRTEAGGFGTPFADRTHGHVRPVGTRVAARPPVLRQNSAEGFYLHHGYTVAI